MLRFCGVVVPQVGVACTGVSPQPTRRNQEGQSCVWCMVRIQLEKSHAQMQLFRPGPLTKLTRIELGCRRRGGGPEGTKQWQHYVALMQMAFAIAFAVWLDVKPLLVGALCK